MTADWPAKIIGNRNGGGLGQVVLLASDLVGKAAEIQMMALPEGAVAWALDRVKVDARVMPVVAAGRWSRC